ncbi:MAG: arsenite efflux transporter metallochaperone ArsD [Acidimicrobiales bacterium]
MSTVEVFDPPMCCSTGVCGPSVDPALATFAADLGWLAEQGVVVERHNLSQEPKAFADSDLVRNLLAERGDKALPAVTVDGALRSFGRYPSRSELAAWAMGTGGTQSLDEVTAELVAIGAAVGANCEPCFKSHYDQARRLGVTPSVMAEAVRVAQAVKDTPARAMIELAARLLGTEAEGLRAGALRSFVPGTAAEPVTNAAAEGAETARGCCNGANQDVEVALVWAAATGTSASGCCG